MPLLAFADAFFQTVRLEKESAATTPPETLCTRLCNALSDLSSLQDYPAEDVEEMQYILAAFADETFLNLTWPWQKEWTAWLVEERLFRSHASGEKVFDHLEKRFHKSTSKSDLFYIYLCILGAGFRGACFGKEADVQHLKKRLFERLYPVYAVQTQPWTTTLPSKLQNEPQPFEEWKALFYAAFCLVFAHILVSSGIFLQTHVHTNRETETFLNILK